MWNTCVKVLDGIWTMVANVRLTVVARPTIFPVVGIAGSVTPITFSHTVGSTGNVTANTSANVTSVALPQITDSDFVVIQSAPCSSAYVAATGPTSLAPTLLQNSMVSTTTAMTATAELRVCYATKESGGNSGDDYTELPLKLQHRTPVSGGLPCRSCRSSGPG